MKRTSMNEKVSRQPFNKRIFHRWEGRESYLLHVLIQTPPIIPSSQPCRVRQAQCSNRAHKLVDGPQVKVSCLTRKVSWKKRNGKCRKQKGDGDKSLEPSLKPCNKTNSIMSPPSKSMLTTPKNEGAKWVCFLGKRSQRRASSLVFLPLN